VEIRTPVATTISDASQEAVLADGSRRLLVEAPPGSGKTWTAVRLVARDVDAGLVGPTQRALMLTFSRNARAQIEGYARELLTDDQRRRTEITNYHSWFWAKVSQYRMSLGLPLDTTLVMDAQRRHDVAAAMETEGITKVARGDRLQVDDYMRSLEFGLAEGRPERLREPRPKTGEIGERLRALHQAGQLHYDDLAYYTWLLVDRSATLRRLWRHKYPVIILDEYQDASPLQAAIVERLAGSDGRVYAFADPLQQIYTWRDASKQRLTDFRANGASEHRLRTLHRYRHRPALQTWMEQARDVLLDDAARVTAARPREIGVVFYDPDQPERNKVWGAESRQLGQIDDPISKTLRSEDPRSVAVLAARRDQLDVLERHLVKLFRCSRLRAAENALDLAVAWVEGHAAAVTTEHHAERLLQIAHAVAPRHGHLDLRDRLGPGGIDTSRLRQPRRQIAETINELAASCDGLASAFRAAHHVSRMATHGQDYRVVDWDTLHALRRVLRAPRRASDAEAAERVRGRVLQARFMSSLTPQRGLYLLSCHEGKGREFDLVVLPYVSTDSFKDDEDSRQLLYVSLTRARRFVLVRLASGKVPPICERLGLA
jgi:superfamily I DNA/RNA helicase